MNIGKLLTGLTVALSSVIIVGSAFAQSPDTDPELSMAVTWMHENGLTQYDNVSAYNAMGTLTRDQGSKFFTQYATTNLCLEADTSKTCTFSDLGQADPTLAQYVTSSCQLGIFQGSNGMFYPTASLTKAQFVTALVRSVSGMKDENVTPRWKNYHAEAMALGITKETDVYALDKAVSRYEAGLMLYRARVEEACDGGKTLAEILEELFGNTDAGTTDAGTTTWTTPVVTNGDVTISLNANSPVGEPVPGGVVQSLAFFDIKATGGDVSVNKVTVERVGLGNDGVISQAAVYIDGVAVSNTKNFSNSDDQAVITFPAMIIESGEMKTIEVRAKVGETLTYNNQEFSVALVEVNGGAVAPVVGSTFEVAGINASTVTVKSYSTNGETVQVGDKEVELADFTLDNDSNNDVYVTSLTFEDDEGNVGDDVENFVLEFDGDVVATVAKTMSDDFVTFSFSPALMIEDGQSEDFTLYGDIVAGIDDEIELILDEDRYIVGYDNLGYGLNVMFDGTNGDNGRIIEIQAGEVTLEEIRVAFDEIEEDMDGYVIAEFEMTVNAGDALLEDIEFGINTDATSMPSTCSLATYQIFEDIELVIPGYESGVSPEDDSFTTTVSYEGVDITLPVWETVVFQLVAETEDNLMDCNGSEFNVTLSASDIVLVDDLENEDITDISPSQITFDSFELSSPSGSVNRISQSGIQVVVGTENVELLKFEVETDDIGSADVEEIVLDFALANSIGADIDDVLTEITLWKQTASGYEFVDSDSSNNISGNELDLDVNVTVPAASTQIFLVTATITGNEGFIADNSATLATTVTANLNSIDIEEADGDDYVIDNAGNFPLLGRTVTIVDSGKLTVELDDNNDLTEDATYVLGGKESSYVAAFDLTAEFEDISISDLDLLINAWTGSLDSFVDSAYSVVLYDASGNQIYNEVLSDSVSNTSVIGFNNMSPELIIPAGTETTIYVAIEADILGYQQGTTEYGSDDVTFAMKVTEAEGDDSSIDVAAEYIPVSTQTAYSTNVAIKPVLLSNLQVTTQDKSSTLLGTSDTLGTLKLTTDTWVNSTPTTTSVADLQVDTIVLHVITNLDDNWSTATFSIESDGSNSSSIDGAYDPTTNLLTFDVSGENDFLIAPGSTEEYRIVMEGANLKLSGTSSVLVEFDLNDDSSITYCVEGDSGGDSCVTDLRLNKNFFGSSSVSVSN